MEHISRPRLLGDVAPKFFASGGREANLSSHSFFPTPKLGVEFIAKTKDKD